MGEKPEVFSIIQEKLEKLAERKKTLTRYLDSIMLKISEANDSHTARVVIEDNLIYFKKGWPRATPSIKKRLLRRLFDGLIYKPDGLYVYYVTVKDNLKNAITKPKKIASDSKSEAIFNNPFVHCPLNKRTTGVFSSSCSSIVINGSP